jgi:hypothetical protein
MSNAAPRPPEETPVVAGPPAAETLGKPLSLGWRLALGAFAAAVAIGVFITVLWVLELARAELPGG